MCGAVQNLDRVDPENTRHWACDEPTLGQRQTWSNIGPADTQGLVVAGILTSCMKASRCPGEMVKLLAWRVGDLNPTMTFKLQRNELFLSRSCRFNIVGSSGVRPENAMAQISNPVSGGQSHFNHLTFSENYPAHFSLYVHKCDIKPDLFIQLHIIIDSDRKAIRVAAY